MIIFNFPIQMLQKVTIQLSFYFHDNPKAYRQYLFFIILVLVTNIKKYLGTMTLATLIVQNKTFNLY